MSPLLAACACIGAAYLVVAAFAFWLMVSYEHVGASGWASVRSKPRSTVVTLAWMALGWLPLVLLAMFERMRSE